MFLSSSKCYSCHNISYIWIYLLCSVFLISMSFIRSPSITHRRLGHSRQQPPLPLHVVYSHSISVNIHGEFLHEDGEPLQTPGCSQHLLFFHLDLRHGFLEKPNQTESLTTFPKKLIKKIFQHTQSRHISHTQTHTHGSDTLIRHESSIITQCFSSITELMLHLFHTEAR